MNKNRILAGTMAVVVTMGTVGMTGVTALQQRVKVIRKAKKKKSFIL